MKSIACTIVMLMTIVMASGCATLVSYKDDDPSIRDGGNAIKAGLVPYALPRTEIVVTTTYNILSCKKDATGVQISASAAIDVQTDTDPAGGYYIDSNAFQKYKLLKTSDLKIDHYPNGILSSINGQLSDQTGQVITSALSAAVNIAGAVGKAAFVSSSYCTPAIANALDKLGSDQAQLAGAHAPTGAALAELQAEISSLTKQLTITASQTIILKADDFAQADQVSWTAESSPISQWFPGGKIPLDLKGSLSVANLQIVVTLHSHLVSGSTTLPESFSTNQSHPIEGIVYRVAVPVDVDVCFRSCDMNSSVRNVSNESVEKTGIMISQLGRPLIAPLRNGIFQDSSLIMSQDQNGNVTDVEFKNSSTISTMLSGIGQIFTTQQTQENAALTANAAVLTAKSNSLTAQTNATTTNAALPDTILSKQADCLTQQAAIVKAGGTPKVSCQ